MTGLEALQALRGGNVKVARSIWMPHEYLFTLADKKAIYPSTEYSRRYPDNNVYDLITNIFSEFVFDDWEIVE
jgi:hypothetical protein